MVEALSVAAGTGVVAVLLDLDTAKEVALERGDIAVEELVDIADF